MNRSEVLRGMLANVGIKIDDPPPERAPTPRPPADELKQMADRELIREILIERGAPGNDLEWMVASCPDVKSARTYRPPEED